MGLREAKVGARTGEDVGEAVGRGGDPCWAVGETVGGGEEPGAGGEGGASVGEGIGLDGRGNVGNIEGMAGTGIVWAAQSTAQMRTNQRQGIGDYIGLKCPTTFISIDNSTKENHLTH